MFKNLLKFFGYLLYTVLVVLLLLWYKFPADAFRIRIEKDLNRMSPTVQWDVEDLVLLPSLHIRLKNISMQAKEEKQTLLTVKSADLSPDFMAWKKQRKITAEYIFHLLDGTIRGRLGLTADKTALEYDGVMKAVRIDNKTLPFLKQEYRRTVQGTLSGNFSGIRK
ncbi:MAG: hypothetical protein D3904_17000, partial [Candidatus Electrothrix sp. EH2]|nr:hypothetical protein [Candidatus Electrothrix sp. EH2]